MTKQYYLTTSPSGIGLIPKEKMPKPEDFAPFSGDGSATKRAIAEAVPVVNKVIAVEMINRKVRELGSDAKAWDSLYGKEGAIYGPFEGEYRLERRQYCHYMNGSGCRENCDPIPASHGAMDCKFKDKPWEVVAILSEPSGYVNKDIKDVSREDLLSIIKEKSDQLDAEDKRRRNPTPEQLAVRAGVEKEPVKESQEDKTERVKAALRDMSKCIKGKEMDAYLNSLPVERKEFLELKQMVIDLQRELQAWKSSTSP